MRSDSNHKPRTLGTLFFVYDSSRKDITDPRACLRTIDETAVNDAPTKSRDAGELKCLRFTVPSRYSASVEATMPNHF